MKLAPIDPNQTKNDFLGWFATHGGLIIGSIVAAAVVFGIYKAMPKWVFVIVVVALLAIVAGVNLK